jgi:arylsulfatase A-like enzyme
MPKPNILIFNPDQFRADALGHLGNSAAHTPILDDLVKNDAVSFRSAFCQNPVCTPSRCSFMSGLYPHVLGHRTMYHMLHEERNQPSSMCHRPTYEQSYPASAICFASIGHAPLNEPHARVWSISL